MNRRKAFILGIPLVLAVIIAAFVANYFSTTTLYTIRYTHVKKVEIIEVVSNGSGKTVAEIKNSGESVRLPNSSRFTARYTGENGYATGMQDLSSDDTSPTIVPDYSASKYASLISTELPKAKQAILALYPAAESIFSLTSGVMREQGKWMVVLLKFKGEYSLNSDNLRILLEKQGTSWTVVTKPDIILTAIHYPKLPVSVLSWANEQTF